MTSRLYRNGPDESGAAPAAAMAEVTAEALYTSGLVEMAGTPAAEAPYQVMEARAAGVLTGKPVVIAFGLGNPGWARASSATAALLMNSRGAPGAPLSLINSIRWQLRGHCHLPVLEVPDPVPLAAGETSCRES